MDKCNCINNLEFSRQGNCFGYIFIIAKNVIMNMTWK